jgi:segregation and condensation protein A
MDQNQIDVPLIPDSTAPVQVNNQSNLDNLVAEMHRFGEAAALRIEEDYRVRLPVFEGPLDLLLHLIRKEQLNIYDIPVAQICASYLEHLKLMYEPDVNIAGEFFVMAATLLQLKSQVLLPSEEQAKEEEDPRLPLVAQLLELERFKKAAAALDQREWLDRDIYIRPPSAANDLIPVESLLDAPIEQVDNFQLLLCLKSALDRTHRKPIQIEVDSISLKEKVLMVREQFERSDIVQFWSLVPPVHKRSDIVVSFMAILELAKLKFVEIIQTENFGPIQIRSVQSLSNLNLALLEQF